MTVRSVDAVVVGGGVAALLTAALLGRKGLRGVVIDQGELAGMDPSSPLDWSIDDRHRPLLAEVHDLLGLQDPLRRRAVPLRPGLRVIGPHGRGELEPEDDPAVPLARVMGAEPAELREGLRSLDRAAAKVGAFVRELGAFPAVGFFERRRLGAGLSAVPEVTATADLPPALLDVARALLPFLTHLEAEDAPTWGRLAGVAEILLRGPRLADEGSPLRAVLEDRARRSGFDVHRGTVTALAPDGRRFRVELDETGDVVLARILIDASADLSAVGALPHRIRIRKLASVLEAARPTGALVRTTWRVDRLALPEALGRVGLVLPSLEGERPLLLGTAAESAAPARILEPWGRADPDPSGGADPAERRVVELSVAFPVPAVVRRTGLEPEVEAVRARLGTLFPFFPDGRPELIGAPVTAPFFAPDLDPLTGLGGLPVRAAVKGLLIAGPVVAPGLGRLEAAYLAARQAVEAATESLGVRA